jgi:hypothetical protein
MSENADQFEEREDGEEELAEAQRDKGYGEDEGEREAALDDDS